MPRLSSIRGMSAFASVAARASRQAEANFFIIVFDQCRRWVRGVLAATPFFARRGLAALFACVAFIGACLACALRALALAGDFLACALSTGCFFFRPAGLAAGDLA